MIRKVLRCCRAGFSTGSGLLLGVYSSPISDATRRGLLLLLLGDYLGEPPLRGEDSISGLSFSLNSLVAVLLILFAPFAFLVLERFRDF